MGAQLLSTVLLNAMKNNHCLACSPHVVSAAVFLGLQMYEARQYVC